MLFDVLPGVGKYLGFTLPERVEVQLLEFLEARPLALPPSRDEKRQLNQQACCGSEATRARALICSPAGGRFVGVRVIDLVVSTARFHRRESLPVSHRLSSPCFEVELHNVHWNKGGD